MKALVIFNPTAGLKSKINVAGMVREHLTRLGYEPTLFYLNDDFENKLKNFDCSAFELVVAVGGDGTVKVATKTIITKKMTASLSIIPFGSANVIALAARIPVNIKSALKILDGPHKTIAIDVGWANRKHYFLVGLSIGYISRVVTGTTAHLKSRFGFFGYLLRLMFNKIKIKKQKFEIKTQNSSFWVKGNSLVIFNTLNYYGFKTKKVISFADGVFNLYVFTNKTFLSLIEAFVLLIFFHRPPRYVFSLDNNYFKIILRRETDSCQIDGDYVKLPKVIEVEILPKAIDLIVA